jgi:uncharacterized membrane-anchored protein
LRRDKTADAKTDALSKVPRVTLVFWIVKILATTGGDALSMTLKLGYAISSLIFLGFFCVTLAAQIISKRYHAVFYSDYLFACDRGCDGHPHCADVTTRAGSGRLTSRD